MDDVTTYEVDWQPLEKMLAPESCRRFMYMGTHNMSNGRKIMLYKHVETRSYLNIDKDGNFYRYTGASYTPTTKEEAFTTFAKDGLPLIPKDKHTP